MLSGHGDRTEQGTKTSDKENQQQSQKSEATHSQACLGLSLARLLPPEETQQALPPLRHSTFQQKQGPPQDRGTKGLIPEQNTGGGGVGVFTVQAHLSLHFIFIMFKETLLLHITNIKLIPSQKNLLPSITTGIAFE